MNIKIIAKHVNLHKLFKTSFCLAVYLIIPSTLIVVIVQISLVTYIFHIGCIISRILQAHISSRMLSINMYEAFSTRYDVINDFLKNTNQQALIDERYKRMLFHIMFIIVPTS